MVTLAAPLLLPPQTPGSVPLIGVGVGVVGGVGVCVLIIVAVVALCFFARRRRRRSQKKTINYASSSSSGSLPADDLRRYVHVHVCLQCVFGFTVENARLSCTGYLEFFASVK